MTSSSLLPSFQSLFNIDTTISQPSALNTLQPTRSSDNLQDLSASRLRLASRESIPLANLFSQRSINFMDQEGPADTQKAKSRMIVPFSASSCFGEKDEGANLTSAMFTEQESDPLAPLMLVRRNNDHGNQGTEKASFFATMMENYEVEDDQDADTTFESSPGNVAEVGFGFDVESVGDDSY